MEIKKECEQYLAEYYQGLFFGNVNKRYRAMTGAELRKRMSRLTEANLKPLVKSNELSDVQSTPCCQRCAPISCAGKDT